MDVARVQGRIGHQGLRFRKFYVRIYLSAGSTNLSRGPQEGVIHRFKTAEEADAWMWHGYKAELGIRDYVSVRAALIPAGRV
jgi:hypothetical protein